MPAPLLATGILTGIGGLLNVAGAVTRKNAAKSMLGQQLSFASGQRQRFKEGAQGISEMIKNSPTYQADTELYQQAQEQAAMQQRQASAQGRMPGEDIASQQIGQNAANAMAAARQGARSGTDLMTAALLGQNISGGQQLDLQKQSMMQKQARIDAMNQQYMNSLYQTASETSRQRQLAFTSEAQKQQQLIGFQQNALQTELGQDYQFFQDEKRARGAYADTVGSIYSGVGDIFTGIAGGMMASSAASQKSQDFKDTLALYSAARGGNSNAGAGTDYSSSISKFNTFSNSLPSSLPSWTSGQ
jgi:hypothetical protein